MRVSLPAPPNRFAAGSAPLTSLSAITSWPSRPKTRISVVLATVGEPPMTVTAPPFTRIVPAALRLIAIELSALSPDTVSTPELKVAVVAAFAGALVRGDHTGCEHGAGEQPARRASPVVVASCIHRVSFDATGR